MGQENVPRKERVALELISFQKIGLEMNPVINQQTSNNQSEGNQRAQKIMVIRGGAAGLMLGLMRVGVYLSLQ